ncbi:MAG: M23 family metallopeptidase [Actinobacteria bacterium]|nr:M23 family metallopeptidase [Actinomycetota bacterium]
MRGRIGIIAAGAALLAAVWAPPARATSTEDLRRVEARLERLVVALERERAALERFAAGARVGGNDRAVLVQARLTVVEERVWRWRAGAAAALGDMPGAVSAVGAQASPGPFDPVPALGLMAEDGADVSRLRPVLADWAAYRRALHRLLGVMEALRASADTGAVGLLPGGRVCPVDGPHHFEPTFGVGRPWGRDHKGEDVHAAWGTPLVALESGAILQAGWHGEGGFGVYLEGYYSGDVYYYAHMVWSAPGIRPGAVVAVGDLVGWVGSSGNATSPHLHLGWIPDHGGPWLSLEGLADPYPLLAGLCGPG